MITEELRQYINMVSMEESDDQLFEMANISGRDHGIAGVVIWVGRTNKQHGLRVKVSNIRNRFDVTDNFVIMMPSLDYDPAAVAKWIDYSTMQRIIKWIVINQQLLSDYETGLMDDTREFLDKISKV